MDFHLDALLNFPNTTVESCLHQPQQVVMKLRFLHEASDCPHCQKPSDQLHQVRPMMIRDLPVFGQPVQLQVPRRRFYCADCQRYFTETLPFVDWERRYTRRYEDYIYQQVQASSIEQVSREEDLSWDQVQGIFKHKFNQEKKQTGNLSNASVLTKSVNARDTKIS
jgi:transposase